MQRDVSSDRVERMNMNSFRKFAGSGLVALGLTAWAFHTAVAEPLLTTFQFAKGAYDNRAGNEIVVTITRSDQDPSAESVAFSVECAITGGNAIENVDYRMAFNGAVWSLGKIDFPPGVHEKSFTVYAYPQPGAEKTLRLALSDPSGPLPAVTGNNPTASISIVSPR